MRAGVRVCVYGTCIHYNFDSNMTARPRCWGRTKKQDHTSYVQRGRSQRCQGKVHRVPKTPMVPHLITANHVTPYLFINQSQMTSRDSTGRGTEVLFACVRGRKRLNKSCWRDLPKSIKTVHMSDFVHLLVSSRTLARKTDRTKSSDTVTLTARGPVMLVSAGVSSRYSSFRAFVC